MSILEGSGLVQVLVRFLKSLTGEPADAPQVAIGPGGDGAICFGSNGDADAETPPTAAPPGKVFAALRGEVRSSGDQWFCGAEGPG